MDRQDRRAPGVERVQVETVVEICGREPGLPAFEAESVELSGRGMHVRTNYLPELDAPIVLRFVDRGREVVIEGEVAWREDKGNGGNFGIRFTALDHQGVTVLKELCGIHQPPEPEEEPVLSMRVAKAGTAVGTAVKLHIEGLGAPMKACVRDGGRSRVKVGSNLEFLRVGRALEVEDLEQQEKRSAQIDGVTIAVEPQSGVPQLVVTLRYDGEELTPEPSVIESASSARSAQVDTATKAAAQMSEPSAVSDDYYEECDVDEETEEDPLRAAFDKLVKGAGTVARRTGGVLSVAKVKASRTVGTALRDATSSLSKMKAAPERSGRPRRTAAAPQLRKPARQVSARQTSARDGSTRDVPGRASARQEKASGPLAPKMRNRMVAGASLIALLGGMYAMLGGEENQQVVEVMAAAETAPAAQLAVAASAPEPATEPSQGDMVANVPLFGPTPMVTANPRAEQEAVPEEEIPVEKRGAVEDESFDEAPPKAANKSPEEITPFQRGRLHLPVIHKLQLDTPGTALAGTRTPTGFTVTIPDTKVLESGRTIAQRDDRIAAVEAKNTAQGAKISFRFRKSIPGYKVRLRKDYVEFFISAPER